MSPKKGWFFLFLNRIKLERVKMSNRLIKSIQNYFKGGLKPNWILNKKFILLILLIIAVVGFCGLNPTLIQTYTNLKVNKTKYQKILLYKSDKCSLSLLRRMHNSHQGHTATLLPNGKVLIVGDLYKRRKAELYDPQIMRFEQIGNTKYDHYDGKAILLNDGKVLLLDKSIEIYDPKTNKFFKKIKEFNKTRYNATLLKDGRVIIVGGIQEYKPKSKSSNGLESAKEIYIYDPNKNKLILAGKMQEARQSPGIATLTNGTVLIVGGSKKVIPDKTLEGIFSYNNPTNTAEIFNPKTFKSIKIISMHISRQQPTLTLLHNGEVLILGGNQENREAELYDFKTQSFKKINYVIRKGGLRVLPIGKNLIIMSGSTRVNDFISVELYDICSGKLDKLCSINDNGALIHPDINQAILLKDNTVLIPGDTQTGSQAFILICK